MTPNDLATVQHINDLRRDIQMLRDILDGATITPAPEWLTVRQAAEKLGCSQDTIRRHIRNGALKAKGRGALKRVEVK